MGTIVEGEWDEVIGLVRRCHETMRGEGPSGS
ncbi:MAG: thiamine-binding protein [Candidatus Moduliflexus flocculans]|nr:thiamine-binding protein [Candidatus Moduliflexus flocculans]